MSSKTFRVRMSPNVYRMENFLGHAPPLRTVYEIIAFDEKKEGKVLYVGLALDQNLVSKLQAHWDGALAPSAQEVFGRYGNMYFDMIDPDGFSPEDLKDIAWGLAEKLKPPYNEKNPILPSGRFSEVVVEEEGESG